MSDPDGDGDVIGELCLIIAIWIASVRCRKSASMVAGVHSGNLPLWQTADRVNVSTENKTGICASGHHSLVGKVP